MSTNGLALDRRSKVRGVVTHQQADGNFFVQDGSGGAWVQAFPKVRLTPGERVEVAGFPALVKGVPTLMESEVRRLGHGVVPAPLALRASEVLKGGHEGELLKVRGRLRQRVAVQDRLPQSDSDDVTRLLAAGAATWQGGKPKGAALVLRGVGKPVSTMVLEDRG